MERERNLGNSFRKISRRNFKKFYRNFRRVDLKVILKKLVRSKKKYNNWTKNSNLAKTKKTNFTTSFLILKEIDCVQVSKNICAKN